MIAKRSPLTDRRYQVQRTHVVQTIILPSMMCTHVVPSSCVDTSGGRRESPLYICQLAVLILLLLYKLQVCSLQQHTCSVDVHASGCNSASADPPPPVVMYDSVVKVCV